MSDTDPGDLKCLAEGLVTKIAEQLRSQSHEERTREWIRLSAELTRSARFLELSEVQLKTIIDAVEDDLRQSTLAPGEFDRTRMETSDSRTRVVAAAVIAIAETALVFAPEIETLRAEMQKRDDDQAASDAVPALAKTT